MTGNPSPPTSVVSGVPYRVRSVNGQVPNLQISLDDPVVVVAEHGDDSVTVYGSAIGVDDHIRIYEKADRGFGKDIRTWILEYGHVGYTLTERAAF